MSKEPVRLGSSYRKLYFATAISNIAMVLMDTLRGALTAVVAVSVPFFIDAGSFFAAAALVALIPGAFRAQPPPRVAGEAVPSWRDDLKEGVRWLHHHKLLWSMAIN